MYELLVKTHFAAAHQLALAGHKCENLHGHNWKLEVRLRGTQTDGAGVVLDFGVIKAKLGRIMDELDHKFLNDLPAFAGKSPSSENIAFHVAQRLAEETEGSGCRVHSVTAWESDDAAATYFPDGS
ncbi:MAG: 6-carboxytetrahydropterin synthase QueD [Thermodesulfobacteriota bacterium]